MDLGGFWKPSSSETENTEDESQTQATLENLEQWSTFEILTIKKDSLTYYGQLVTFPSPDSSQIYIFDGGLNNGEQIRTGHTYHLQSNTATAH